MKQVATTVDAKLHASLGEIARSEESSMARVLRRAAKREVAEHDRNTKRLINGKTRRQVKGRRKASA
ncbi:MAG: hypothetical protein R2725_05970 [Solirubrobacterales bacterium]